MSTQVCFDGSCPLCRAEIEQYRKLDQAGRFSFLDVSDPASRLPAGLDRKIAMSRFHVVTDAGEVFSGARAFVETWQQCFGSGFLTRIILKQPVIGLLEICYRGFLILRPGFVRAFVAVQRLRRSC